MILFAGLGNPGAKYAKNRHNIGFMALDAIAEANGFGPWRTKFQAQISEGRLGAQKVCLIKPQTFMNLSGQAVGEAMRFYKLTPDEVTVFHDELDLAPGKLRVKKNGGHAGHNGLRSLHQHIGDSYTRVRLGIGHPGDKRLVNPHVLGDFAKADQDWLQPLLDGIAKAAPFLADGVNDKFMSQVALGRPPEPSPESGPGSKPKAAPEKPAQKPTAPEPPDTRSALQRLMDKFS